MINKIASIHFTVLIWGATAEFVYDNLYEYRSNLTAVYKDPGHVFGEDLLRTTVFFLDELMELEEALDDPKEEDKALKILNAIYEEGGPKHIKNVPYQKFIDTYGWTKAEVDAMASYVRKTSTTWDRLLLKINDFIECAFHNKRLPTFHDVEQAKQTSLSLLNGINPLKKEGHPLPLSRCCDPFNHLLFSYGSGHEIVSSALIYQTKLKQLHKTVEGNRFGAMGTFWEIYLCGGPPSLKHVPYEKFLKLYKWNTNDFDEYVTIINKTKQLWTSFIELIERISDQL